jgi:hypothetical protein
MSMRISTYRLTRLTVLVGMSAFVAAANADDGSSYRESSFLQPMSLTLQTEPADEKPAQGGGASGSGDLSKKLSNPISDLISVPFQVNYDEGYSPGGVFTPGQVT